MNFLNERKRINNADLFSQPPLVIFTKGANISGGHCIPRVSQTRLKPSPRLKCKSELFQLKETHID